MTEIDYIDRVSAPGVSIVRAGHPHAFPFKVKPMSEDWKSALASGHQFWFSGNKDFGRSVDMGPGRSFDMRLWDLQKSLVAFGGEEACLPAVEDDLGKILERGQLWPGKAKKVAMEPGRCHENSCTLWANNPGRLMIATGYALSSDGMWRAHSWCIDPSARKWKIIETTLPRELYFGFVMDLKESLDFCEKEAWLRPEITVDLLRLYKPEGVVESEDADYPRMRS